MTSKELRELLMKGGPEKEPPKSYLVDAETYANACQSIFEWCWKNRAILPFKGKGKVIEVVLGPHKGLMFKNVELIYAPDTSTNGEGNGGDNAA